MKETLQRMKSLPTLLSLGAGLVLGLGLMLDGVLYAVVRFGGSGTAALIACSVIFVLWLLGGLAAFVAEAEEPSVFSGKEFVKLFLSSVAFALLIPVVFPGVMTYLILMRSGGIAPVAGTVAPNTQKLASPAKEPQPRRSASLSSLMIDCYATRLRAG